MSVLKQRFIIIAIASTLGATGCRPPHQSEPAEVNVPSLPAPQCLAESVVPPWKVAGVYVGANTSVGVQTQIEAPTDELVIGELVEGVFKKRVLEIDFSLFREYRVVDPKNIGWMLQSQVLRPVDDVDGRPAKELAPFDVYANGTSRLLVNRKVDEFCTASPGLSRWVIRCQLVRGRYAAAFMFLSGNALARMPELMASLRPVIEKVISCIDGVEQPRP